MRVKFVYGISSDASCLDVVLWRGIRYCVCFTLRRLSFCNSAKATCLWIRIQISRAPDNAGIRDSPKSGAHKVRQMQMVAEMEAEMANERSEISGERDAA